MAITLENEINKFYENILNHPKDSDMQTIIAIIKDEREKSGFYELCQKYLDIPLNADKWISEDKMNIECHYNEIDIEIAAESTKAFATKYQIIDYELLLEMIYNRYKESISFFDKRPKTSYLPPANDSQKKFGYFGKTVIFTNISAWSEISKDIIKKMLE